jgi:sulfate transport system ATP-binding protein
LSIRLEGVQKRFGDFPAIHDISLEARPGEFMALLGPSGSGKTTLLRIMAGFELPDAGSVWSEGQDVTGLGVRERNVGFVFQQYALFKHMTVADNVGFGLSVRKRRDRPSKAAIRERAQELLDLVQLGHLGGRYPGQLSGGQRQRVALARALAIEPRLLLLDEPFGALDAKVRKELRRWLRELHDRVGLTSIFVTHDQEEALELADRVVVMSNGSVEQVATPQEVYQTPANAFVFDFVGESNAVPVTVTGGRTHYDGRQLDVPVTNERDGPAKLYFRPHDAVLADEGSGAIMATVTGTRPRSGGIRVEAVAKHAAKPLEIDVDSEQPPRPGDTIGIKPTRARLFAGAA